MNGNTTIKTGGKEVISSGTVIPYESDEITELSFDYEDFKLSVELTFRDSNKKKDKDKHYYVAKWVDEKLKLEFINAAIPITPGGPTDPIKLGTSDDQVYYLRIRIFGVDSQRMVIHYTLYSVLEDANE